jgi:hypothetical protein
MVIAVKQAECNQGIEEIPSPALMQTSSLA